MKNKTLSHIMGLGTMLVSQIELFLEINVTAMQILCYFHSKYKSKISITYTEIGTSCKIPYGHGSIYRFFSQDVVKVRDIIIKDQLFAESTKEGSLALLALHDDGILGLEFEDISIGEVTPVWYNIIDQGYIYQNVFSLCLNKDPMAEIEGEIVIGGINSRHFRGEHTYVLISQKGYWQIDVGDVLLANRSTGKAIQEEEEEEEEKEEPPYANLEEEEGGGEEEEGGGEEEELMCANLEEEEEEEEEEEKNSILCSINVLTAIMCYCIAIVALSDKWKIL
nr:aspartic proteinase A2 isoform X1 [Arachis hypogaea]